MGHTLKSNSGNYEKVDLTVKSELNDVYANAKYHNYPKYGLVSFHNKIMQPANLERLQNISWIKGEADAFPCHFHISVCL